MKLAVVGTGKTGSEVIKLAQEKHDVTAFNSQSSLDNLKSFDVIVVFVPGDAMKEIIPLLVEARRPCVIGSTGFKWPKEMGDLTVPWIFASNFSLGMQTIKRFIKTLEPGTFCKIHEVHHVDKVDAPSGTALTWASLVEAATGKKPVITFERRADVFGEHSLTIEMASESITLLHQAKERALFAKGALLAAEKLYKKEFTQEGIHHFDEVLCT